MGGGDPLEGGVLGVELEGGKYGEGFVEDVEDVVVVGVAEVEGAEVLEVGGVDGEADFFKDFADDGGAGGLAGFELAAGDAPGVGSDARGSPLEIEEPAAGFNKTASSHGASAEVRGALKEC